MNQLQVFKNELFEVGAKTEGDAILFNVEQVARCLGITTTVQGKEYIRWGRVNEYLPSYLPDVAKGDFIPESLVYKLAFKASNDVAEKFQDWLAIEVIPSLRKTGSYSIDTTQLSPELQMFNHLYKAIASTELKQREQDERLEKIEYQQNQLEREQENISQIVSLDLTEWKDKVNVILNKIALARGGGEQYRLVRNESYELLEKRGHCRLNIRLENRKKEALSNGIISKAKIEKFKKIDVIAGDPKLIEIYLAIVKEMAITHKIKVEGLGA
ncbi:BRO family protein [Lysinibacillus sp. YS11]|uniref:BRO-N domain-containing protein n=1 Tax=Lysinibacillus sp. YS11 TaxID=2072025 RepID=UPI0013155DBA|nr:BRO family protein [Lysinibacillus sp. YS11]